MTEWSEDAISVCTNHYEEVSYFDNGDGCPRCPPKTEYTSLEGLFDDITNATYTAKVAVVGAAQSDEMGGMTTVFSVEAMNMPKAKQSSLERKFIERWELFAPNYIPVQEYRFHEIRKWRFDFAWPDKMVAVEMEGGVWSRGRHVRPQGFINDLEKYNTATELGWRVLRYESAKIEYLEQLKRVLSLE